VHFKSHREIRKTLDPQIPVFSTNSFRVQHLSSPRIAQCLSEPEETVQCHTCRHVTLFYFELPATILEHVIKEKHDHTCCSSSEWHYRVFTPRITDTATHELCSSLPTIISEQCCQHNYVCTLNARALLYIRPHWIVTQVHVNVLSNVYEYTPFSALPHFAQLPIFLHDITHTANHKPHPVT
jgi:hypothetical protein